MNVFEIDVEDLSEVRVTREMVSGCDDIDTLSYWFESLDERTVQIKEFLEAFKFSGAAKDDWLYRTSAALAYNKIGMKWVERRLLALGAIPPYPEDDPRGQQIYQLQQQVRSLRAQIVRLSTATPDPPHSQDIAND